MLRSIDPTQPVSDAQIVSTLVARSIALPRMNVVLLSLFAGVGVTLAVVGLYGLLAYTVAERSTEWGIRMALGGQPHHIRRAILREGARLVLVGIACGLPAALAGGRLLQGLLFGIRPADPAALAGAISGLALAAALGCYLPARRATRADPAAALRGERA
jgi:putative ABC transport system permease protein